MCRSCDGLPARPQPMPITERVQRWDVYDIADELADVPGMIDSGRYANWEIVLLVEDLGRRLWAAADRGGSVGPAPEYQEV